MQSVVPEGSRDLPSRPRLHSACTRGQNRTPVNRGSLRPRRLTPSVGEAFFFPAEFCHQVFTQAPLLNTYAWRCQVTATANILASKPSRARRASRSNDN